MIHPALTLTKPLNLNTEAQRTQRFTEKINRDTRTGVGYVVRIFRADILESWLFVYAQGVRRMLTTLPEL